MEEEQKERLPVNKETLDLLLQKIHEVNEFLEIELRTLFKLEESKKVVFKLSSIYFSLINRTIEINRGYITLLNCENFICAISLIRIQVENCLRFYGFSIMDNMPKCLDKFIDGIEFKDLTGNNGNKLYDSYLAKELDKKYSNYKFYETYKDYCEILHFSGIYQNINTNFENKIDGLSISLYLGGGNNMPHFDMNNRIKYTTSVFYSSKIIFRQFKEYRIMMEKVLENY